MGSIFKLRRLLAIYFLLALNMGQGMMTGEQEAHENPMPFKLGFEFQESRHLCKWALEDVRVQKKPLFWFSARLSAETTSEPLLHIVLDGSDIEFVTRPFSNSMGERAQLEKSMKMVQHLVRVLEELLRTQKQINFQTWMDSITSHTDWEVFDTTLICGQIMNDIKEQLITRPGDRWIPQFTPQVTIQHPVQHTIPLYFGMFGLDDPIIATRFLAALPNLNVFKEEPTRKSEILESYRKEMNGLAFLHALTLVSMVPIKQSDEELLGETIRHLEEDNQVDPKRYLALMHRRPFSSMFHSLVSSENYPRYFRSVTDENRNFMYFSVAERISNTNYAEQFFDSDGRVASLIQFSKHLKPNISAEIREKIEKLLYQGVISTIILKYFNDDVQTNDGKPVNSLLCQFYPECLKSVQEPYEERYRVNVKDATIESVSHKPHKFDLLSILPLLHEENSMGGFKDDEKIDKKYGEAIVEVRSISSVGAWFLKEALSLEESQIDKIFGKYLGKPVDLVCHSVGLYDFLSGFATKARAVLENPVFLRAVSYKDAR